jgi:hypothetical protein
MAVRNTQHVVDLETRCASERVQPNDRRPNGAAPANVESRPLRCCDHAPIQHLCFAVQQRAAVRQHARRRSVVGVDQLDWDVFRNPPGAV